MESLGKACTELKQKYEDCFNKWYTDEFLKGQFGSNPCQDMFEEYRACVMVAVKEKNLENLLDEARKEHLKPMDIPNPTTSKNSSSK